MENTLLSEKPVKAELAGNETIPTLASVSLAFGQQTATQYVRYLLQDLFDFAEHQQNVNIHRVEEAAQLMATTYDYLNLAELLLFFAECKMARYGTFFGSSGPTRVAQMLNEYCKERDTSIQTEEARKHNERLQEPKENGLQRYLTELEKAAESGDMAAKKALDRHNNKLINLKQ